MNENFHLLIDNAKQCLGCVHEGLIVTSANGTILETSPAAERILEAPSTSLKGKQVREICPVQDVYDDLVRQTDSSGRTLNKSILVLAGDRSEEHTSELQSRLHLVCRLLLEKKKKK